MINATDIIEQKLTTADGPDLLLYLLDTFARTNGLGFAGLTNPADNLWHGKVSISEDFLDPFSFHNSAAIAPSNFVELAIYSDLETSEGCLCLFCDKIDCDAGSEVWLKAKVFSGVILKQMTAAREMSAARQQLKEQEVEIKYLQKENRQYAHITTHTLKEPLRKMQLFSHMLQTECRVGNTDKACEIADRVYGFARQFADLIDDVSRFANLRPVADAFEDVDLNEILLIVCAQVSTQIQQKEAWIEKDALPTIRAVPLLMAQLFLELVRNALWFTRKEVPPVIRITSSNDSGIDAGFVTISIADNGIGIADYHLERVFDVFERFHPEKDLPGSGIGLSYCRKIVHYHGGSITANSVLGEGTTFLIRLPLTSK